MMGAGATKAHEASQVTPSGPAPSTSADSEAGGPDGVAGGLSPAAAVVLESFAGDAEDVGLAGLAELAAVTVEVADLDPAEKAAVSEAINNAITDIASNAEGAELLAAASETGLPLAGVLGESDLVSEPELAAAVGKFLVTQDVDEQLAIHAAMAALANDEKLPPQWAEVIEHLDGDETWTGSLTEFHEAVAAYDALAHDSSAAERLAAVNKVWGYTPDPDTEGAVELVGWARQKCPNPSFGYVSEDDVAGLVGSVSEIDKKWLSNHGAFAVASMATPMSGRLALKAKAQAAEETFQTVSAISEGAWSTMPTSIESLDGWVDANAQIVDALANPALVSKAVGESPLYRVKKAAGVTASADQVTKSFRGWAKTQKLAELREAAIKAGLKDASSASRAQIQNYLASKWDPNQNSSTIQNAVTAKASAGAATPATPGAPGNAAATTPKKQPLKAKPSTTMAATPVSTTPSAFHSNVVSLASKAATASKLASDVPAPTSSATVSSHDWASAHVGAFSKGSHESHLYTGPDGSSQWMYKPDKSNGGARAHAEATASKIYAAAGVATVDVHVAKIGNKIGAIQPMIAGAKNLNSTPAKWTQSDVDQIVANHVVSWAVGDHDGHSANMLRTPSGAIVGIDHGQAFKFCGTDKLSATWKPSSNPAPAVHTQLYSAAKNGSLGDGVNVKAAAAIPAIKKLQNIPDHTYRSWLAPTATEGVKHGVHWVPAMREAAQSRHGTKTVTNQQIADEFMTTMVDRKNNLSKAFSGFFADQGIADAAHVTLLAPPRTAAA